MKDTNPKTGKKEGWRIKNTSPSLPEVFSSISVNSKGSFWKRLLPYIGPGLMVAVGYMDPGNWATDIAGGSKFGYTLLTVIFISNLFAILLQHLSLKLGIVAERDLAQACRDNFPPVINIGLWILCEVAIAACDLAEVIGSAIAMNLLFGIPLLWGIGITAFDVLLILMLQSKGFRFIEAMVAALIITILGCFCYELAISEPDVFPILSGFLPKPEIVTNPGMLYIAIGILGATVMPHNLYLHSSIVQTRNYARTNEGKKAALKFATIDSTVALLLAFFINAAILITSAAAFHEKGYQEVADIYNAHMLLSPVLGSTLASTLFAVALLASGQNSTLTGTLAGQIVMEGFLNIKLPSWLRRIITRFIAIAPAFIVTFLYGEKGTSDLLVLSQVVLSMQLSFAVFPLIGFTSSKTKMKEFVNKPLLKITAWAVAFIIAALNAYLLYDTFS